MTRPNGGSGTGSSGGSGTGSSGSGGSGPGRIVRLLRAPFEGVVAGGLILIPLFAAIAWVRGQS